jgi:sarcosine oxidase subunit beta
VVIVGGGVIGLSTAFHLAEAGVHNVVVVERGALGAGSTVRSAGGIRAQFSDELNIQIAHRSIAAFVDFGSRPGWEIDFKQVGYLFLLSEAEHVARFERNVALQNQLGVPSRMLAPDEAKELSPLIDTRRVLAAAYSPADGHATPEGVVQGYAAGARSGGVHIETNCEVLGIGNTGAGITSVTTSKGLIATNTVICCAGAWSGLIGSMAGQPLPVIPVRRQIMFTDAMDGLPEQLPMTIDFSSSFYFHREGPGLLMGMSVDEAPGFNLEQSDEWIPSLIEAAEHTAPAIATAGIKGGWAGLYEVTPDHNAIVGESRGVAGFFYATGFSGHGFLQAPAVGEIMRDLVTGHTPFCDVAPLSIDRFDSQRLRPEFNVV